MHDANDLCRRAMLTARMAEHHGLSEISDALFRVAACLPPPAADLPRIIVEVRSYC